MTALVRSCFLLFAEVPQNFDDGVRREQLQAVTSAQETSQEPIKPYLLRTTRQGGLQSSEENIE